MINRNTCLNLLLLTISLAISLFLSEIFLRAVGYYGVRDATIEGIQLVDDPVLDYRLTPNNQWISNNLLYKINKHGWRDYDYDYAKPDKTFRILVLGDSITNGHGVNVEDIYAKQLENRLNAENSSDIIYQVIMFAMGALSTTHEAHLLEIEGLKYDPDIVIVQYCLNDPHPGYSLKDRAKKANNLSMTRKIKRILERSSLIHFIYRKCQRLYWNIYAALGYEYIDKRINSDYYTFLHTEEQYWNSVVASFEKINSLAKLQNMTTILVIFPVIYKLDNYQWKHIHKQVSEAAIKNNFLVLDLLNYYQGHQWLKLQVAGGDHIHPSKFGHKIAGDALYEFLLDKGLLPS